MMCGICAAQSYEVVTPPPPGVQPAESFDPYLARLAKGVGMTDTEKQACHVLWQNLTRQMIRQTLPQASPESETIPFNKMSPQTLASHYIISIKIAMIDEARHRGWPYHHPGLRQSEKLINELAKRIRNNNDPYALAAAVIPAYHAGEYGFGYLALENLKARDRFLYRKTLAFLKNIDPIFVRIDFRKSEMLSRYFRASETQRHTEAQRLAFLLKVYSDREKYLEEERDRIRAEMSGDDLPMLPSEGAP